MVQPDSQPAAAAEKLADHHDPARRGKSDPEWSDAGAGRGYDRAEYNLIMTSPTTAPGTLHLRRRLYIVENIKFYDSVPHGVPRL